MTFFRPLALLATTLLWACAGTGQELSSANSTDHAASAAQTKVARGYAFAKEQCSGCHALHPGEKPPNPQAPSFVAVANDMGFSQSSLHEFFRDKHDTPAAMSIELEEEQAEIVAAYIMSLRSSR